MRSRRFNGCRRISAPLAAIPRVTVGGHSAGGVSVADLLTSPLASGLFRSAIVQSGPPTGITPPPRTAAEAEAIGAAYMRVRGATTLRAMRALPAQTVLAPRPDDLKFTFPFTPIVDGHVLPRQPADLYQDGATARVPLMIGVASGESGAFGGGHGTPESFAAFAFGRHGEDAAKVLATYPHDTPAQAQTS